MAPGLGALASPAPAHLLAELSTAPGRGTLASPAPADLFTAPGRSSLASQACSCQVAPRPTQDLPRPLPCRPDQPWTSPFSSLPFLLPALHRAPQGRAKYSSRTRCPEPVLLSPCPTLRF